jgi:hypothetical protein
MSWGAACASGWAGGFPDTLARIDDLAKRQHDGTSQVCEVAEGYCMPSLTAHILCDTALNVETVKSQIMGLQSNAAERERNVDGGEESITH